MRCRYPWSTVSKKSSTCRTGLTLNMLVSVRGGGQTSWHEHLKLSHVAHTTWPSCLIFTSSGVQQEGRKEMQMLYCPMSGARPIRPSSVSSVRYSIPTFSLAEHIFVAPSDELSGRKCLSTSLPKSGHFTEHGYPTGRMAMRHGRQYTDLGDA